MVVAVGEGVKCEVSLPQGLDIFAMFQKGFTESEITRQLPLRETDGWERSTS